MKGIIVYKGKYGATRQYAEWAATALHLPVVEADAKEERLCGLDFVVIGTSVYMGKLLISQWLKKNLDTLKTKKIYFFLVAGTPPHEKEKLNSYILNGVPEEIRQHCEIYFLPGRLTRNRLSWKDKLMLRIGAGLTKDPVAKKTMLTDFNYVKKENITGLVNSVKNYYTITKEAKHIA